MLINGSRLISCPILSLHIGGEIARVTELIIDPNTLKLIAVRVDGPTIGQDDIGDILPINSVREFSRLGMVIDSSDDFTNEDDVISIQKIIKLNFALPGLKVVTRKKIKLGKVTDFILNSATWDVYQLIVQRPPMKALLDPELLVSRSQIHEVDDYQVVVKDEHDKAKSKTSTLSAPTDFIPDFVNPFRKPDFAHGTKIDDESRHR